MSIEYVPKEISSLMGLIDAFVRLRNIETRSDRSYKHYHPSEWGKCLRVQQYKHYAELGLIDVEYSELGSTKLRLFHKGHNMHSRWVQYFEDIGNILRGIWKCHNPTCFLFDEHGVLNGSKPEDVFKARKTRIYGRDLKQGILKPRVCVCGCSDFEYEETPVCSEELNIRGRADVVLDCSKLDTDRFKKIRTTFDKNFLPNGECIVGDMKTIGSSSWKNQLKAKGPHKEYLIQLTIYAHLLDCAYGVLMYENKDTSELMWYQVPRNDKWWEIIQWQAKAMIEMADNKRLPPPKSLSKSTYACKMCEFKNLCHKSSIWNDPDLTEKRRNFYKSLL